jgi:DNA-binding winged helix-turn-helix (wHTH) protein/TolB-like protein/Flp pilus assembly protein TadD
MSHQPKPIYEFGPYLLDAVERLLSRDGEVVPLQPKVFDLLLVLVERHGRLLEKDELMKAVWPDTVVEEVNLANNISILRKTISENGRQLIETVPKRGYRFVAPVREREEPVIAETKPQSAPPVRGISHWARRQIRLVILLAILLIGVAGAISYRLAARRPAEPGMAIKSIAVLPLRALHSSERDEAMEMGAASILITRLGSLRQLIVRPESAVERYARPDQDPLAAGREQKVDAALDIRYQRLGDKFRFTLRLLRVADEATLWADTLDQQAADLFAVEDAISGRVANALRLMLSSADKELLAKRYTSSSEAWLLYVRGRRLAHTRLIPDVEKSILYFEQAIDLDHDFALAHAMLGFSYASLGMLGRSLPKEVWPKAKAAYDQALKLDDQLAEAHSHLANYRTFYEWDYNGAEQEYRRALDLNPNSADSRHYYAFHMAFMGRLEQAISEIRKAEELDPTDIFISKGVAQLLYFARRYDEAIEQSRRLAELYPNSGPVYDWIVNPYEMKGDEQGAFDASLKQAEAYGRGPDEIVGMKAAFAAGGLKGYWRRDLDRLLKREKSEYIPQFSIARDYARLGEKEQALARLQKAVDDRNFYVVALKVEPLWDSYRADTRFVKLAQRVGLEP